MYQTQQRPLYQLHGIISDHLVVLVEYSVACLCVYVDNNFGTKLPLTWILIVLVLLDHI